MLVEIACSFANNSSVTCACYSWKSVNDSILVTNFSADWLTIFLRYLLRITWVRLTWCSIMLSCRVSFKSILIYSRSLILIYFLICNHRSILILTLSPSSNHYAVNFSAYSANWLKFRFVHSRLKHFETFNLQYWSNSVLTLQMFASSFSFFFSYAQVTQSDFMTFLTTHDLLASTLLLDDLIEKELIWVMLYKTVLSKLHSWMWTILSQFNRSFSNSHFFQVHRDFQLIMNKIQRRIRVSNWNIDHNFWHDFLNERCYQ